MKTTIRNAKYKRDEILVSICMRVIRWVERDSNYIKHAKREFDLLYKDLPPEELVGPNTWIRDNIIDLLAVLGTQGHSGGSIGYCLSRFEMAARFRPLTALTGNDDEWGEWYVGGGEEVRQNKRMSCIFQTRDGLAYNVEGYVFQEQDGGCFTGRGSIKYIEFPYSYEAPTYIKVDKDGIPLTEQDRKLTGRY